MNKEEYELWLSEAKNDPELMKGLKSQSKEEMEEAFTGELVFGTGGMRGIMGYGPNRMCVYTLRKANYGLAKFLLKNHGSEVSRGVVISHDCRTNSRAFALECAKVLGAFGIKSYLFDDLRTTPELSFSVKYMNAIAGIMVTASHNPPKYNGYKIYNADGCQYTPYYADQIIEEISKIDNIFKIPTKSEEELKNLGLLKIIGSEVDRAFLDISKTVLLRPDEEKKIKIVYTPLHGCGNPTTFTALKENGFDVTPVEKQMVHDPTFKTVKSPNPEDPRAFELSEQLGLKIKADLLLATDPDADRVGIGVFDGAKYQYLSGNQTGALLVYYRLNTMKELDILPKKGRFFDTVVTSDLAAKIAKSYGYKRTQTLTGFKFIGEQAKLLEGTDEEYVFGYEESFGYIIKDYVKDKDSIQSCLAIAEMANHYLIEGKNLCEVLDEVYEKYGFFREYTRSVYIEGIEGPEKMAQIMDYYRNSNVESIGGLKVLIKEDYLTHVGYQLNTGKEYQIKLPKSNVLKFYLENESWVVLRPSGTEPKLKIYYEAKTPSLAQSEALLKELDNSIYSKIEEFIK